VCKTATELLPYVVERQTDRQLCQGHVISAVYAGLGGYTKG